MNIGNGAEDNLKYWFVNGWFGFRCVIELDFKFLYGTFYCFPKHYDGNFNILP